MMNKNFSFLSGFALGAAFMYAFDPTGGRRRRALVRDKVTRAAHIAGDGIDAASRDLSNRAAGTVAEARRRLRRDQPEDEILVERVRAALGRAVSHPKAIDVDARGGTVRLCGPILSHEVNSLLRAVESVPGVTNIDNQLDPHDQAGNIPALQGGNEDTLGVPQW